MGRALDTTTIENILACILGETEATRFYVIANDEMNKVDFKGSFPFVIIQNTDFSTESGTHWVCYYVQKRRFKATGSPIVHWDFFDSYGNEPSFYNLNVPEDSVMSNFNRIVMQSDTSTLCGHFCIHYAYHRAIGLSFETYIEKFGSGGIARAERRVRQFSHTLAFRPCKDKREPKAIQSCCRKTF